MACWVWNGQVKIDALGHFNCKAMLTHSLFETISTTRLCWCSLRPFQPQGYADTQSVWDHFNHQAMLTHSLFETISTTRLCWHTVCLRPFQPQGYADTLSVWDQVWTVLLNHTAEMACVSTPLQHTCPKPPQISSTENPYHNGFQTNVLFTTETDFELSSCLRYSETADERPHSCKAASSYPGN